MRTGKHMRCVVLGCGLLFAPCLLTADQEASPGGGAQSAPPKENVVMRQFRHMLSNLDQEVANCVQNIHNQEQVVESMRQDMSTFVTTSKEQLKTWGKSVEKVLKETKQCRANVDATMDALQELKKKCQDQEELSRLQSEQIRDLESALRSLVQAVKPTSTSRVHEVVSGDTLEKIADKWGTTVRKIKEKNDLKKDTIFPGQKLEIP
jgi:LysM repeat protein